MRWGDTLTLEFVKLYLKQDCLWNPVHPGYKVKSEREKAYYTISTEFEAFSGKSMNVHEIKGKIKNLRTTYAQQVHKILQKSGPDAMYEPSLIWFHEMDRCLKNVPMNIRHSIVTKYQQQAVEVDSSTQMWISTQRLKDESETQNEESDEMKPDPLVSNTDEEYIFLDEGDELSVKKDRRNSLKKLKKKKVRCESPYYVPDSSNGGEDEFDIYGKFIASQLRQMDLQKALRLQVEIQSLVSEARISDLT